MDRRPESVAGVFDDDFGIPLTFIGGEVAAMNEHVMETGNRSLIGMLNEVSFTVNDSTTQEQTSMPFPCDLPTRDAGRSRN